jgi:hypothetical protein
MSLTSSGGNEFVLEKTLCKLNALYEFSDMSIDKQDNIYVLAGFRGSINIDTIAFNTTLVMDIGNLKNPRGVFCIKLDSNLNIVFIKKLFESSDLKGYSAPTFDSKNNCIFNLSFKDTLLYNGDTLMATNNVDGLLLKTDENLNPIIYQQFGNYNDDYLSKLTLDEFDNYYLAGTFNTTWTGYSPAYPFVLCSDTIYSDRNGMFIAKFDSNFNCIWHKDYHMSGDEIIGDFKYYKGALYATLEVYNGSNSISFGGLSVNYANGTWGRLFLAKIDSSNGTSKWLRSVTSYNSINNLTYLSLRDISVQNNKIFIIGGINSSFSNTVKFEGSLGLLQSLWQVDYFVGCYDTSGNFIWNTISQSYGSEALSNVIADSLGNVIGIGSLDSKLCYDNDTLYSFGNDDALAFSYDKNGNYLWSAKAGGSLIDQANDVVVTQSGKLIVLGTTNSPTCAFGNTIETFPGDGNYLFLASIDSLQEPFGMQSEQSIADEVEVFPNPVSNMLNIKSSLPKYQLFCYNTLGELVLQSDEKQKNLNLNHLPNGIYQIKIISDKQYLNKKILIQH